MHVSQLTDRAPEGDRWHGDRCRRIQTITVIPAAAVTTALSTIAKPGQLASWSAKPADQDE